MKKTLITAVLAFGMMGAAFGETTYTLGDVTYTTTNPMHPSTNHSGHVFSSVSSFTFTLTASLFNNAATTTQTVASNGDTSYASTADSKVSLTSITLWEKEHQNYSTIPDSITIKDSNGTTVATSSSFTRHNDQLLPCNHDGGTWTFSGVNLLTVGSTYTVEFATWNIAVTNLGASGFATTKGDAAWQPASLKIVTTSVNAVTPAVPEPATATLSLLALAGLATRRRRK